MLDSHLNFLDTNIPVKHFEVFRRLEDVLEDEKLFAGFELKSGFAGKLVEILTLILSLQAQRHALTLQICTVRNVMFFCFVFLLVLKNK